MSTKWSLYMQEIYGSRKAPPYLNTVNYLEVEEAAREKMKDYPSEYIMYASNRLIAYMRP